MNRVGYPRCYCCPLEEPGAGQEGCSIPRTKRGGGILEPICIYLLTKHVQFGDL